MEKSKEMSVLELGKGGFNGKIQRNAHFGDQQGWIYSNNPNFYATGRSEFECGIGKYIGAYKTPIVLPPKNT